MPTSKKSSRSLERQVAKTIFRYIDSAITTPPKHQPFQKDSRNFSHFFSEFCQENLQGFDLDHAYERKPDDPSWLLHYSNHAINSVCLVLALHEQSNLVLEGQSAALPALDSISLKNVFHETFRQILHVLADANEHLRLSEEAYSQQVHNCTYGAFAFRQAANSIDLHQHYGLKPDDPDWLERYSNQAINTVRLALALRDRHESAFRSHLHSLEARLSLDYVDLKDMSRRQFLEIFHQLVEAERHAKINGIVTQDATSDATPSQCCIETISEADESEQSDEGAHDHDHPSETGSGSESGAEDVQTTGNEIFNFESEEDFKRELANWDANEALEDLPEDVIGPLVDKAKTRKITVTILRKALGVTNASNEVLKENIDSVLRELRRQFRIGHTQPFPYGMIDAYRGPLTPLICGYLLLSNAAFTLRSHSRTKQRIPNIPAVSDMMVGLDMVKKDFTTIVKDLVDFSDCQKIMLERLRIANIRLDTYQDTMTHYVEIGTKLETLYTFEGPANKPRIILQHESCKELQTAVEAFMQFDEARLGKEYFDEFPGCLVKACGITALLRDIIDLKCLPVCSGDESLIKAVDVANGLLKKWRQRSNNSENYLYVNVTLQ